jgi:hypothetical protein
MPRTIAVVLNPDFGASLGALAFRLPVWIVDTGANRVAAEDAWRSAEEWPHISVTMFRTSIHPTKGEWLRLFEQIELHHGPSAQRVPYETLEVIGTELTPAARAALAEAGLVVVELKSDGFRVVRVRGQTDRSGLTSS